MNALEKLITNGNVHRSRFSSWEEYMDETAQRLVNSKNAKPGFKEALIQRESKYPTGLQTQTIAVSMPHAEFEYVEKEMIDVTIFEEPVKFKRMDDPTQIVQSEISFMLLLKEAHQHLEALQELVAIFQNPNLSKLKNISTKEELLEFVKEANK